MLSPPRQQAPSADQPNQNQNAVRDDNNPRVSISRQSSYERVGKENLPPLRSSDRRAHTLESTKPATRAPTYSVDLGEESQEEEHESRQIIYPGHDGCQLCKVAVKEGPKGPSQALAKVSKRYTMPRRQPTSPSAHRSQSHAYNPLSTVRVPTLSEPGHTRSRRGRLLLQDVPPTQSHAPTSITPGASQLPSQKEKDELVSYLLYLWTRVFDATRDRERTHSGDRSPGRNTDRDVYHDKYFPPRPPPGHESTEVSSTGERVTGTTLREIQSTRRESSRPSNRRAEDASDSSRPATLARGTSEEEVD